MKLQCHCKNVTIEVNEKPETLTSCNCSICNRYGALWGYYHPSEVSITLNSGPISKYLWGDKYIEFTHCSVCGCMTHYETTEKVSEPKMGINFRMAEPSDINEIIVRKFDGAKTWKYLK